MAGGTLQAVALTAGDLNWIALIVIGGASLVARAIWHLATQFKLLRDEIALVNVTVATARAEAAGNAKHNDTRFEQHSDRMIQQDARIHELEQWRLRHTEDHQ